MGKGRDTSTSSIKNNNGGGGDPPGGGGGGPQVRQKLRVGESAGSAAASASGGAMLANLPSHTPPAPRPASSGGNVLSRLANMDAGRAVRAIATGGLTEAPALARAASRAAVPAARAAGTAAGTAARALLDAARPKK